MPNKTYPPEGLVASPQHFGGPNSIEIQESELTRIARRLANIHSILAGTNASLDAAASIANDVSGEFVPPPTPEPGQSISSIYELLSEIDAALAQTPVHEIRRILG